MKRIWNTSLLVAVTLVITGCANLDFDRIAKMEQKGNAFQKSLHKEYVRLARMEGDEYDWTDAGFFNDRAEASAMGKKVGPQAMAERDLPDNKIKQMTYARSRLVKALSAGAARKPQAAARAQAGFDCWMQEQEENFQPDDINACKRGFLSALAELEEKPMQQIAAKKPKPLPRRALKPKPLPFYKVNFAFDSAKLDATAMAVIGKAAATIKEAKVKMAQISGHADRSGSATYNLRLSKARTAAVSRALAAAGVAKGLITQRHYGETRMLIQTPDGKRQAANRRVHILLSR